MKASITNKLESLCDRHEEIAGLLAEPDVMSDQNQFRKLSVEYSQLEPVVETFTEFKSLVDDLEMAEELLSDPEMKEMAQEEIKEVKPKLEHLELELQKLLLPKDANDDSNVYLEVRAGTGGDEASIFAGDLFRMYSRYAESQGWRVEVVNANEGEHGGYKEIVAKIIGSSVYSQLKFESGAHRVQRVPETESQGRVHTSAATVAIMPEIADVENIEVNMNDVRVDTFRASGAGGQHVNKTDSAVRLTHLPTGTVVECQEGRSQHKNKAQALSLLQSRIMQAKVEKQAAAQSEERKNLVGSGDRSERIRTYNYPQGRVTDHRINLTLYKLGEIMEGKIELIIKPLINEHQADQLAALGSE